MDEMEKAPNIVPKGAIRLSEAFERLYRSLTPEWKELSERCVQWDEASLDPQEEARLEDDPYRVLMVTTDRAENIFRWALRDGDLRAYIHNVLTGIDLELDPRDWLKSGEQVGIGVDYTGPQMPGPDCALNGMRQPIFLPAKTSSSGWPERLERGRLVYLEHTSGRIGARQAGCWRPVHSPLKM
jgi:hypothetical protein